MNPYFAKTDEQSRFTTTNVPTGAYKLVMWHPFIRTISKFVTVVPKRPQKRTSRSWHRRGAIYANEALEHDYARYCMTKEPKKRD